MTDTATGEECHAAVHLQFTLRRGHWLARNVLVLWIVTASPFLDPTKQIPWAQRSRFHHGTAFLLFLSPSPPLEATVS